MNYTNATVRRQDRLLDENEAKLMLKHGEYGVLSMQAEEGGAYSLPINYVWDENQFIYLHCAPEGRKLRCIELCNKVSFCVVGKTHVLSNKFSTEYESIVLQCIAYIKLSKEERMKALELFLDRFSTEDKAKGMQYIEKYFDRTEIIRLDIQDWSGKCKKN